MIMFEDVKQFCYRLYSNDVGFVYLSNGKTDNLLGHYRQDNGKHIFTYFVSYNEVKSKKLIFPFGLFLKIGDDFDIELRYFNKSFKLKKDDIKSYVNNRFLMFIKQRNYIHNKVKIPFNIIGCEF